MEWFLILGIYGCHAGVENERAPSACYYRDQRLVMPSQEVCQMVLDMNGGRCIAEITDPSLRQEIGKTMLAPRAPDHDK